MRMPTALLAVIAVLSIGCNGRLAGETATDAVLHAAHWSGGCWEFVELRNELPNDPNKEAAITLSPDQRFRDGLIERQLLYFGADGALQSWTVYRDEVGLAPHCSRSQWQWDGTALHLAAGDKPFTVLPNDDELVLSRFGYRWRYRKLPGLPALTAGVLTAPELTGEWRLVESSGGPSLPIGIAGYRLSFAADGRGRDDGRFGNRTHFAIVDGTLMLTYDYVAQSTVTVESTEASRSEDVVNRIAGRRIAVPASVAEDRLTLLLPDPPALLRFARIR